MDKEWIEEFDKRLSALESDLKEFLRFQRYPNNECYTYEEMAEMTGYSVAKIREEERRGALHPRYPNAKKRFHRHDVDTFLRGYRVRKERGSKQ